MKKWSEIVQATLYKLFIDETDEDSIEYTNKMPYIANECLNMIANDIHSCVREIEIKRLSMTGEELEKFEPNPSERTFVICTNDYKDYAKNDSYYFFDGEKPIKTLTFTMPKDFLAFGDSPNTLQTNNQLIFHPKIIYKTWNKIILPENGIYTISYNAKYGEIPLNIPSNENDAGYSLDLTESYTGNQFKELTNLGDGTYDIVFNGIPSQVLECLPSYIAATFLEQDDLQRAMILRNEFESMVQRLEDRVFYENESFVSSGGWY